MVEKVPHATQEGFEAVENRAHVHDLHATVLHLMGLDHEKLTYKFQGRPFRLNAGNPMGALFNDT